MIKTGNCYEMNFTCYGKVISFYVRSKDSFGNIEARICGSEVIFNFNENELYTRELATLIQIDCDNC